MKVTLDPAQTGFWEAETVTLTVTLVFSVMVIVFEVAGFPMGQETLEFSTHDTISPLAGMYEYTGKLAPTLPPFTFHWYWGEVPSFVGDAVKVMVAPWQKGFAEAVVETLTARTGLTTMMMELDVSGLFMMQGVIEEVRMQRTTSLFIGIKENELEFPPALTPLTCHRNVGLLPSLTAIAVKATGVPEQTFVEGVLIVTLTDGLAVTSTGKSVGDCDEHPLASV